LGAIDSLNKVDNKYIGIAVDELVGSLGIKDSIPIETIHRPFCNGKVRESIEAMANYLGLPIAVNLQYVPATYQPIDTKGGHTSARFESSSLVETDSAGRGIEGITAQVSIPSDLPLYGTPKLQGFRISVKVSDNCRKHAETFMALMAHELSHVLLHSIWHTQKDNEIYTDLTAMILGFSDIIRIGRKVVETQYYSTFSQTSTTTYGYLSDKQFDFALDRVKRILRDKATLWSDLNGRAIRELAACREQLYLYRKMLSRLNKFIEHLDRNPERKIRRDDVPKVVEIHGPNYIQGFTSILRSNEKKLKEVQCAYSDQFEYSCHYTTRKLDSLRTFCENLNSLATSFAHESDLLKCDVAILGRCIGFWGRLKANRRGG
jgi:hypothetical protein